LNVGVRGTKGRPASTSEKKRDSPKKKTNRRRGKKQAKEEEGTSAAAVNRCSEISLKFSKDSISRSFCRGTPRAADATAAAVAATTTPLPFDSSTFLFQTHFGGIAKGGGACTGKWPFLSLARFSPMHNCEGEDVQIPILSFSRPRRSSLIHSSGGGNGSGRMVGGRRRNRRTRSDFLLFVLRVGQRFLSTRRKSLGGRGTDDSGSAIMAVLDTSCKIAFMVVHGNSIAL
jgi:hypothetical protein